MIAPADLAAVGIQLDQLHDSPATQARLGCAMARAGRAPEAVSPLREAMAVNPFDRQAARALFQTLEDAGFTGAMQKLARERRLLSRAAPGLVPLEDWAMRTPLIGDELVSIIILCCNQLAYTEQCIQSVIHHSRRPYELVMVNNGSSDGTAAYLNSLHELRVPERVEVIHNRENLGFAKRGVFQRRNRDRRTDWSLEWIMGSILYRFRSVNVVRRFGGRCEAMINTERPSAATLRGRRFVADGHWCYLVTLTAQGFSLAIKPRRNWCSPMLATAKRQRKRGWRIHRCQAHGP